ncbi:hypothetical protein [Streptomyces sp. SID12488]|uniref:hypothetical protein n=1 Tax=Streptomyces sp. SID12488 TaxID=2706040 RepID=UPI0013DAADF3|nr:hypothetical protein [Streptomyces sp. SID12488]NEA66501.1 hypothetical protein [Streptomyces sp. SID12488]
MSDRRWVREESRITWEAMSRSEHAAIVRAALKGESTKDSATALLALHWAWAVIGSPGARRRYPWQDVFLDVRPTAFLTDIYDGKPRNDVRTYVRRDARRVEAAYLPFLESLGVETAENSRAVPKGCANTARTRTEHPQP